jgi:ubiquitin-protein ligase
LSFPFSAPIIKFVTRMFHPNIDENGVMQLAILRDNWNPTYDMRSLLNEIKNVLKKPNFDPVYCVNTNAKNLF